MHLWMTFGSGHLPRRMASGSKQHREWCILGSQGFFLPTRDQFLLLDRKGRLEVFLSSSRIQALSPWLSLCVLVFLGLNLFVVSY